MKKLAVCIAVLFVATVIDVAYIYFVRTRGGLGFRIKVLPEIGL